MSEGVPGVDNGVSFEETEDLGRVTARVARGVAGSTKSFSLLTFCRFEGD